MPIPLLANIAGGASLRAVQELQRLYAGQLNRPITLPRDLLGPTNAAGSATRNYYITFTFKKYERRAILEQPFYRDVGTYTLPIPKELVDTTSVSYEEASLGTVVGMAAEAISYAASGNATDAAAAGAGAAGAAAATAATGALQGLARRTPGAAGAVAQSIADNAVPALRSLTGLTPNPFQTVLFKNPQFKTHRFSWRFIPRDEQESVDLRDLIRAFKYHMLPGTVARGVLFTFPEIVQVRLHPDDKFTYMFKPCVIETMNVNYAPNGPSFYRRTDAPTAVDISINLKEIEFWTKNDFGPEIRGFTGGA